MYKITGIVVQIFIAFMVMQSLVFAGYPVDPSTDIQWACGTTTVADISCAFNIARQDENSQLNISMPNITLPDQTTWDGMTDNEKALYLVNAERIDRGLLPLHGVEPHVIAVAQGYADYLLDNDVWGHDADGTSPWDRLNSDPEINACHDFLNVAENLAVFVSTTSIPLSVERAVYIWMYDDSESSWGHRHAILWSPYNDNSGLLGKEGFIGIGRAVGGPYQGPFSSSWTNAEIIVMNVFDPCSSWNYQDGAGINRPDLNGDGRSVLFWRNRYDGNNSIWTMNGTGFSSTRLTRIASQNWQVGCFGDFDGNGSLDILWCNRDSGQNTIWFMDGLTKLSSGSVYNLPPSTGWELAGSGDFNGDGRTDLFWRNRYDGNNSIWTMNGTGFSSTRLTRIASQDWQVACFGDFDGNGNLDILWRNEATGQNTIWFMNGLTKLSSGSVYNLPPSTGWELAGSGDFDGDGKDDLFWRNHYDGNNSIWSMNGTGFSSTRLTRILDQSWQIGCFGDFDGNGSRDILWRNEDSGQNTIWFMDDLTKTSSGSVYPLPPASRWELQN